MRRTTGAGAQGCGGTNVTVGNFRPDNREATKPRSIFAVGDRPAGRPMADELGEPSPGNRWTEANRRAHAEAIAPSRWRPS